MGSSLKNSTHGSSSRPDGSLDSEPRWPTMDWLAAGLLDGPLTALIVLECAAMLATWIPHYLTWPFWSDADGFAMMAQAWDAGDRPYRDIASNQFPGPIYGAWILGKLFGWGRTMPAYAVDAGLVILFGAALLLWSRRCFGRFLPGAIGFLAMLWHYLNLGYTHVLQRDWHASVLVLLGLMILQACPGRVSRLASALAVALALSVRPQVVLFLPAVALAIHEGVLASVQPLRATIRALLEWTAAFAALAALAFAPLLAAGLLGDFWRCLRHASYGGGYGRLSVPLFVLVLAMQLMSPMRLLLPVLLVAEAVRGRASLGVRRAIGTWLVAYLFVLFYRPMSPVPIHGYLEHPLTLVVAIHAALLAAIVVEAGQRGLPPWARLFLLLIVLGFAAPGIPRFCDPLAAIRSVHYLMRAEEPAIAPPGYATHPGIVPAAQYCWDDYRALLCYLRKGPRRGTRVASLLYGTPALLGSTGRLSVFPYDAGIRWLRFIDVHAGQGFIRSLELASNSVVVWIPQEQPPDPDWGIAVLRSEVAVLYEQERRFGLIEVWRRKSQ